MEDKRIVALHHELQRRLEAGGLLVPTDRSFYTSIASLHLTIYFDVGYTCGCLRGLMSWSPDDGGPDDGTGEGDDLRPSALDRLGFSHEEIKELEAGFEGWYARQLGPLYLEGQRIRREYFEIPPEIVS